MTKDCSLCRKETSVESGKSCKFCGMPLEDPSRDFCSKACRINYRNPIKEIN